MSDMLIVQAVGALLLVIYALAFYCLNESECGVEARGADHN